MPSALSRKGNLMCIFDRWFETQPQALASGKTMRTWLRKDFYNGSVSEIAGVVHAQWTTGEVPEQRLAHAYPQTVEDAMQIVESAVPTGQRR